MVHRKYLHVAKNIQSVCLGWMCMNGCGWHECVWFHLLQVFQDDVSGNIEIVVSLYFRSFLKVVLHYILWFLNIWCRAELNGDAASWLQSVIVPCDILCWFYPLASLLTLVYIKKFFFCFFFFTCKKGACLLVACSEKEAEKLHQLLSIVSML